MIDVAGAEGLSFRYRRVEVFESLDFELGAGVTALLGRNGAGKSTLLGLLATLHRPRAGALTILGMDASRSRNYRELRRRVSFLPQKVGFIPSFTVREAVEYAGWLKGVASRDLHAKALRALDLVDLTALADRKIRTLSGGMIRRVGIAQATVSEPELLLLDEPTAGLDPEQRLYFRSLVESIGETCSILISTHLLDDVRALCERVAVLDSGVITFSGSVEDMQGLAQIPGSDVWQALEQGWSVAVSGGHREA